MKSSVPILPAMNWYERQDIKNFTSGKSFAILPTLEMVDEPITKVYEICNKGVWIRCPIIFDVSFAAQYYSFPHIFRLTPSDIKEIKKRISEEMNSANDLVSVIREARRRDYLTLPEFFPAADFSRTNYNTILTKAKPLGIIAVFSLFKYLVNSEYYDLAEVLINSSPLREEMTPCYKKTLDYSMKNKK